MREQSDGERCVRFTPIAIADGTAKDLFQDRSWRLAPVKRQDADARNDEVLDEGCICPSNLKCPLERPHGLLGIGCRTSLANRFEERRRIEAVPIHDGSSIATGSVSVLVPGGRFTRVSRCSRATSSRAGAYGSPA
jgi:hypothetical protein